MQSTNFDFSINPYMDVAVEIKNEQGQVLTYDGVLVTLEHRAVYDNHTLVLEFAPSSGKVSQRAEKANERHFPESRTVYVTVPSLTAENIALAAAQAGVGATHEFSVTGCSGSFVMCFRIESEGGEINE